MFRSREFQKKHAVECLRFAADCRNLAQSVDTSSLRTHFLQMAKTWTAMADHAPAGEDVEYREVRTACN
jgi:hypothetical protein